MKTLFCILAVAFTSASLLAQTTGTIAGTVTDSSKAVMAGVKVSAGSQTSGERRETTTNRAGEYTFAFLRPGDYELQFSIAGFATTVQKATLAVTERIAVDAMLHRRR